jgi:hypothetical protein
MMLKLFGLSSIAKMVLYESVYLSAEELAWQTLTTFQLRDRLSSGLFWGYRQGESLQSLLMQSYMESADTSLWVGYIDGTLEGLPVLLQEMRCLAHQQGYPSVGGFFPKTDLMLGRLTIAGYHPSPHQEVLVYEAAC